MNILVVYGTYSGGTQAASEFIVSVFEKEGFRPSLVDFSRLKRVDVEKADLLIIGSPSWFENGLDGQPHIGFTEFFDNNPDLDLSRVEVAIFGLGDESYTYFCGAVDIIESRIKALKPKKIFPDLLKINQYFMDVDGNNKKIELWLRQLIKSLA